jgi:hypothetical protein
VGRKRYWQAVPCRDITNNKHGPGAYLRLWAGSASHVVKNRGRPASSDLLHDPARLRSAAIPGRARQKVALHGW